MWTGTSLTRDQLPTMESRLDMKKAFTLIELLIVVAIIAILAAIAVPNFLEAQTRSKVSRVKSDLRTSATAIEAYYVDNNAYPRCHVFGIAGSLNGWNPVTGITNPFNDAPILERLSTPVAYITTALTRDVFNVGFRVGLPTAEQTAQQSPQIVPATAPAGQQNSYIYQAWNETDRVVVDSPQSLGKAQAWLLHSAGPDSTYINLGGILANDTDVDGPIQLIYDPTNGTVSFGSIFRAGGMKYGDGGAYAAGSGLLRAIESQD